MRILFVRHAEAIEAVDFKGADLDRPLTRRGTSQVRAMFKALARMLPKPDIVVCSKAVRARKTADILAAVFRIRKKRASSLLNPGCSMEDFRKLVAGFPNKSAYVAVVGHEPDLSELISGITAGGHLLVKVKKGACIEVEMDEKCRGLLRFAVPPELLVEK